MPTTAPAAERYVEFDEFVDFQLHKTESAIKTADVLTAVVGVAAAVVGYLLAFVIFDHWIVPGGFGYFARAAMLGGVVLAAVGWVVWKVVLPARRRVNSLYAARAIERTAPEAKSTLLNLVDLRRSGRPVPPQILGTLEKRAALMLSHVDVEQAVDRKLLMRLAYALLIVVVGFCLYTLFSPKKVSNSVWRALFPAAQVEVATQTQIVDVKPGDMEVLPGAQLEVLADLSGQSPENVTLYFSTADRRVVDEPLEMLPVPDGVGRHRALLVGEAGRGIRQNMTYRVEAGDGRSDTYRVTVLQPPTATVTRISYDYPEYMNLDPRDSEEPRIEAWEGTRVTLAATTNVPIEKAWIEFSDDEQFTHRAEELRVAQVEGTSLRHTWTLELRPIDVTPRSPKFYRIRVRTAKGERDPAPIVHGIAIRPDDPPEVRIVEPRGEKIEAAANAAVPLLAEARDDFAMRSVSLQLKYDGKRQPLDRALARHEKTNLFGHMLELDKLLPFELEAGSVLEYRVEARDNKPELGQATFSEWRKIRITDEELDPEQKEQQRQDARQQQRKQIDEAQQEAGDGQADQEQQRQQGDQNDGQQEGQQEGEGQDGDPMNADGSGDADQQEGRQDGDPNTQPQTGGPEGDQPQDNQSQDGPPPEGSQQSAQRGERGADGEPQPQPLDANGKDDDAAIQRALKHLQNQDQKQDEQRQDQQPPSEAGTEREPQQPNEADPQQSPAPGASDDEQSPRTPGGSDQDPMQGSTGDSGDQSSEDSQEPGSGGGMPDPMNESPEGDPNGNRGKGAPEGEPSPSSSNPSSEPPSASGTASGDETGPATADRRPDADPVKARNELERQDDEDPQTRPSNSEDPDRPEKSRQETGEPEADQQTRTEPNGTRQVGEEPTVEPPADNAPINENESGDPREDGVPEVDPEAASNNAGEDPENRSTPGEPGEDAGDAPPMPGEQADEGAGPATDQQPGATEQGSEEGSGEGDSAGEDQPAGDARGRQGDASGDGDQNGPVGGGHGGSPGSDVAEGTPDNAPPSRPEDANLEYNKKATELVLQRLQEQLDRGEVDEELKKKLGWDEDQIRKFVERTKPLLANESPDDSPNVVRQRKRFEEMLRGGRFDMDAPAASRTGEGVRQRDGGGFTPRQAAPPPEYRPQYQEYLRRINRGADADR